MRSPLAIFLSVIASLTVVQGISLTDALIQAGASQFAAVIASDSILVALYNSSQVQTVFAPIDGSQVTRKRETIAQRRGAEAQGSSDVNMAADLSKGKGKAVSNNDPQKNLGNQPQNVVTNPSNTTQSNVAKRKRQVTLTTILPAPPAETVTITFSFPPDCTTTTILPPPTTVTIYSNAPSPTANLPSIVKIFSGLGNFVNVIKADIPYDGGIIHLVDDYFTLPQLITDTATADNHTTFAQLSASANLTSSINNTPEITCFIPTNAAFAPSNSTASYSSTSSLLSGHIIPNFLGYLPSLTNGATFTTQGGGNVTITQRGNDIFVNNAKIIDSNLITQNGVCHVIDSVIIPTAALPPPFTGDAPPLAMRNSATAIALWGFALALGVTFLI